MFRILFSYFFENMSFCADIAKVVVNIAKLADVATTQ